MDITILLSQNLRKLREQNGNTQKEIAELLHCAQVTYSKYETGKRCIPIQSLIKLAKFYNVSIDYLLGISDNKLVQNNKFVRK